MYVDQVKVVADGPLDGDGVAADPVWEVQPSGAPVMTSGPSAYGGICARCGVEVERVSWADDSNVFTAA